MPHALPTEKLFNGCSEYGVRTGYQDVKRCILPLLPAAPAAAAQAPCS